MESPWSGQGRGLVLQRIWSKGGELLVSCVQEVSVSIFPLSLIFLFFGSGFLQLFSLFPDPFKRLVEVGKRKRKGGTEAKQQPNTWLGETY